MFFSCSTSFISIATNIFIFTSQCGSNDGNWLVIIALETFIELVLPCRPCLCAIPLLLRPIFLVLPSLAFYSFGLHLLLHLLFVLIFPAYNTTSSISTNTMCSWHFKLRSLNDVSITKGSDRGLSLNLILGTCTLPNRR